MIKQDVEIVLWQVMKEALTTSEYEGKESLTGVSTGECTQNGRSHPQNADAGKGSRFSRPATDVQYWGEPNYPIATVTTLLSGQGSGKTTVELSSMLSKRNDKVLREKVPLPGITLFIEGKFWFLKKGVFNVTANICDTCFQIFTPKRHVWVTWYHRKENSRVFEELSDIGPGVNY